MLTEQELAQLRHDAEAAKLIGDTIVCRVNCCVLLGLIDELESHRLVGLVFERRNLLHPAERD